MLLTMSEQEASVRLQIFVPERIRRRLKSEAADDGLEMSELGSLILDHALGLMAQNKTPPALKQAIEAAKQAKQAKQAEADEED